MKIRTIKPRISNKLVNITIMEMFKMQVRNSYDTFRYKARDMSYTPNQLGGIAGQRIVIGAPSVMEVIEFEVT